MRLSSSLSSLPRRPAPGTGLAGGAAGLAGCVDPAGTTSPDPTETALDPAGEASGEISILDDNTNLVFKNGLIDAFQKETGIKVKTYEMANFNDLHDRFATLFAAEDSSIDVIMTWAGWSAEFGQAGWLHELPADAIPSDLIRPALDAVSWDSKV